MLIDSTVSANPQLHPSPFTLFHNLMFHHNYPQIKLCGRRLWLLALYVCIYSAIWFGARDRPIPSFISQEGVVPVRLGELLDATASSTGQGPHFCLYSTVCPINRIVLEVFGSKIRRVLWRFISL